MRLLEQLQVVAVKIGLTPLTTLLGHHFFQFFRRQLPTGDFLELLELFLLLFQLELDVLQTFGHLVFLVLCLRNFIPLDLENLLKINIFCSEFFKFNGEGFELLVIPLNDRKILLPLHGGLLELLFDGSGFLFLHGDSVFEFVVYFLEFFVFFLHFEVLVQVVPSLGSEVFASHGVLMKQVVESFFDRIEFISHALGQDILVSLISFEFRPNLPKLSF